jgi:hypothetical protein
MTGSQTNTHGEDTRPISVAELLAKNGTIGAPPVTGRRRRRRGNSDAVTVAELTGEIPVITDETLPPHFQRPSPKAHSTRTPELRENGTTPVAEQAPPTSIPHRLPVRPRSGAEGMSPDPLEDYADMPVDVMDTEVREAEPPSEDSAYVRSYLTDANELFGGPDADVAAGVSHRPDTSLRDQKLDEDFLEAEQHREQDTDEYVWSSRRELLVHGGVVVLQSILAVAFGAGLFIAFDQLWQWNNILALVLAVLVILGLVAAVQVVRKTVDTASTLIAVAVGALIAFGPLALLQSG